LQTGLETNRIIFEDKTSSYAPSARKMKKKKSKPAEKVGEHNQSDNVLIAWNILCENTPAW
jgi:hypothetical protein